jgi:glycine/D-amino acid oxidase-like deaminating enzyme
LSALLVIGGGVMGLFTAFRASEGGARVTVLERGRIGDPMTASYGRTRSYRSDYLDAEYVRFAREAMRLWDEFEASTGVHALIRCGCMNVAKESVTPRMETTYAEMSRVVLEGMGVPLESLSAGALRERFPWLDVDVGHLEADAGVVDLQAVRHALVACLAERGVEIIEGVEVSSIASLSGGRVRAETSAGEFTARALVITAGHGTNDVLARLEGCSLQVPLSRDRPTEAKYFVPPKDQRHRFTADAMPVVAYLDTGIYLHPIVEGVVDAVKIGYYNPPDLPQERTGIDSVADFVEECLPGLSDAEVSDVTDVDGCDYDLVADDDFVLGRVPGVAGAYVGVGWRGTGYKFAPWVGRVLAELALQDGTVYDIARFDPGRFEREDERSPTDEADPAAAAR